MRTKLDRSNVGFRHAVARPLAAVIAGCALLSLTGCPIPGDGTAKSWKLTLRNLSGGLLSVSGTATGAIYAVGADPGDGRGPLVVCYDGQRWTRLDNPGSGDLWWITDRDIEGAFFMGGENGLMMRYRPATGQFTVFDTPGTETIFGVWGISPNNVIACGGFVGQPDTSGVIWRYDGVEWRKEDLSSIAPDGIPVAFKVWGRSDNEIYVCGELGLMLRYDGASWSQVDAATARRLFTVHGNDSLVAAVGGVQSGVLVEGGGASFASAAPAGLLQMNGIFVPETGQAVAVGREGAVALRTDSGWQPENTGLDLNVLWDYHAAWIDGSGDIWAVGGNIAGTPRTDGFVVYYGARAISSTLSN